MSYTIDNIKKIVEIIEQIGTFTGAELPKNKELYEEALQHLLNVGISPGSAEDISYDNVASGLTATDVQAAIDELKNIIDNLTASDVAVVPSGSLTDTNVQDALETIFGLNDGHETRISALENGYVKSTNFELITGTVGSITIPTGGIILLDQFAGVVDAIVSEIDASNTPTYVTPRTAGGALISVSSFDTGGNYTLSGTPASPTIAILYVYRVQRKDFDYTKSIGYQLLDPTAEEIEQKYDTIVPEVTQAEAEAGTVTARRTWTPERVKQAVQAFSSNTLQEVLDAGSSYFGALALTYTITTGNEIHNLLNGNFEVHADAVGGTISMTTAPGPAGSSFSMTVGGVLISNASGFSESGNVDIKDVVRINSSGSGASAYVHVGYNFVELYYDNAPGIQNIKIDGNMTVGDANNSKGLVYAADYKTAGLVDDRWIPDLGGVKNLRGLEPFFLNPQGVFGTGGGWADSGFIDDVPHLFYADNQTEKAIYMFFALNRIKLDIVDPKVVFLISSVGLPVATTGDKVVWQLEARYRSETEAHGGAADETLNITQTLTNLTVNARQSVLEFTLDKDLIDNEDYMHFILRRIGGDAADNYIGDVGVGQSGIIVETIKHNP